MINHFSFPCALPGFQVNSVPLRIILAADEHISFEVVGGNK